MQIPRALLDGLTKELNSLSEAGQQMVLNAVENTRWGSVAELRETMAEAMEAVCGEVAELAAARAAEFYDDVRELSVGQRIGASVESGRSAAATEGAVRALVKSVADTGATERFGRELAGRVDYEIKKAAGDCVIANGSRDSLKPRFARVPSGAETCAFCIMLASRGFVYSTDRSAGSRGHYHANCDCRIVPSFDSYHAGPSRRFSASTTVEGYDLDGLYRRYVQDLRDGKLNLKGVGKHSSHVLGWSSSQFRSYSDFSRFAKSATDIEDLQLRCAVIEQEWPKTGLGDKYYSQLRQTVMDKRSSLMGDAFYEKPRAELEEHEKAGVDHLVSNGIIPTVKQENPKAPANIDFEIDGELWEMKNVSNAESSVSNQVKRARVKWFKLGIDEPMRCVFTCEGCSDGFEAVCSALERRRRDGEEFFVLSATGELAKLT